jgi:thiamine-phosphate pyrophosphorylase
VTEQQSRRLPRLLVVTDASQIGARSLVDVVAECISGGARAVWLREKQLARPARAELAATLYEQLEAVGGVLVVGSDPTLQSHGVHLAAADDGLGIEVAKWYGRSCHSRADVVSAAEEGCAYATLSPVFSTASKPGYGPALGVDSLGGPPVPIWALGGIDVGNVAECLLSGAAGVAVMGAVMRADEPAAVTAALLEAINTAVA